MDRRFACLGLLVACSAAAEPLKLVVPDFSTVGISAEKGRFFSERLAGRLAQLGANVTTARSISQVLGLERQRQLLGCEQDSACTSELASALGADAVVVGDVARIDDQLQVNLKLVSGTSAKIIGAQQAHAPTEAALLEELDRAALLLAQVAAEALHRDAPKVVAAPPPPFKALGFTSLGLAVAAGVGTAFLATRAQAAYVSIPQLTGDTPVPLEQAKQRAAEGKTLQTLSWVCGGVGVAAGVGAAVLLVAGFKAPAAVSVSASSNGVALRVGGSF